MATVLRQAQGERWRARLPSTGSGRTMVGETPFDRLRANDGGPGSLRQAPFDRLRANDGGRDSHSPLTPHSLVHILSPTAT